MSNPKETRSSKMCAGMLLLLAVVLGVCAVVFSPIIIWPAAAGGLLPFSYSMTAWLEIASLPGCFLLACAAMAARVASQRSFETA